MDHPRRQARRGRPKLPHRVALALLAGVVLLVSACTGGGSSSREPAATGTPGGSPGRTGAPGPSTPDQTPGTSQPLYVISARALRLIAGAPGVRRALDSPRTYVLVSDGSDVPDGWQVTPTASFTSFAQLEPAVTGGRLPAGVRAVLYDNEGWSLTPVAEQRDPATYMARAGDVVHAQGLTFIAAPAVDLVRTLRPGERGYDAFLATGTIAAAAKTADLVVIQAQGSLTAPAKYQSFVRQAAGQARQARAGVQLLAGLSTGPSGQPVTLAQLRTAMQDIRGVVHGYWINIPSRSQYCPRCTTARPDLAIGLLSGQ